MNSARALAAASVSLWVATVVVAVLGSGDQTALAAILAAVGVAFAYASHVTAEAVRDERRIRQRANARRHRWAYDHPNGDIYEAQLWYSVGPADIGRVATSSDGGQTWRAVN